MTEQAPPLGTLPRERQSIPELHLQTKVRYFSAGLAAAESSFAFAFPSSDCSGPIPTGYTRIFIAYRSDSKSGTGSAADPFDGSTAQRFDTLLRTRSENGVTNLVVCIGPGTFETEGEHDYVIGVGHLNKAQPAGFTVNQGWRVHGAGMDRTILKLADLYLDSSTGGYLVGRIITTHDLDSQSVEVSHLTLDDNYPALKQRYKTALQLEAVVLRSARGGHWIHNIHVMNASGETTEAFPVEISSQARSQESSGNVVEYVTMDHWGSGKCTAIAIDNAIAEVRYNTVVGYQVAYGGWKMSGVRFHDNYAIQTPYGFNIDSLQNSGVVISHNQIVHPLSYGMVIGGIGQFSNFLISGNTITMASPAPWSTLYGLIFQGNVTGAQVTGNKIISDHSPPRGSILGLFEKGNHNTGNVVQGNQISSAFKHSLQGADCVYDNVNEAGAALRGLNNTQATACEPRP